MKILKKFNNFIININENLNNKDNNIINKCKSICNIDIEDIDLALDIIHDRLEEDPDNDKVQKLYDDMLLISLDMETSDIIEILNNDYDLNITSDMTIEEILDIIEDNIDEDPELQELYDDLLEIYDDVTEVERDNEIIEESKKRRKSKAKHKRKKKRKSKRKQSSNLATMRPYAPYGYYNNWLRPYIINYYGGYGHGHHHGNGDWNHNDGDGNSTPDTGGSNGDIGSGDMGGGDSGGE